MSKVQHGKAKWAAPKLQRLSAWLAETGGSKANDGFQLKS